MVKTENAQVAVDGRLITINGFALEADPERRLPEAQATFADHDLPDTAQPGRQRGRDPDRPGARRATPASTDTGGAP